MKLASILLGFSLLLSGQANALSNDELFADARDAYRKQDDTALAADTQQLQAQNYILAPYADYWLMLLRMSEADNDYVRNFLNHYAELPFADRVRGEWLKKLGKQQDWQTFLAELPNFHRDDTVVSCYVLQGQSLQGNMEALAQGKALWMVAADQPANCNLLFDSMINANVLTEEDIWARFRLALAENKIGVAKSTVKRIKNFDVANLRLLDRAYQNPQQILENKLISLKGRYGHEVNLYALERLAHSQPSWALVLWQKLQTHYSDEDRGYLWGRFALHAANRHDPIALEWFEHAQEVAPNLILDKEQLAWKARAALREKNWDVLQSAIAAMSPAQQEEGVWRYWKARALKEQQQLPAANAILAPLSTEQNYYGLLAQEELGDAMSALPSYYKASEEEVRAMMNLPGIQRALELWRLDMRGESKLEWVWAVNNLDDRQLIAAAEVAFRADWYDMAINTADKTKFMHDFSLRYPTPYLDMMQSYARENNLDEAWVYGLIRQESRFTSRAKSSVGASGLMQVMPATAKWIAKRLGLGDYRPAMIHELDTNIQFGTHYLRYTLDAMDGQSVMATAAYNAGPNRPKRWAAKQALEGAIYTEGIPLSETREYVKKVMANACFYAQRLGTKAQTLKQRLGVVAGTNEGGALAAEENE